MIVAADDEANLGKSAREPLFLIIVEMNSGNNEIRLLSNFRQESFDTLHDVRDIDPGDLVWMAQCFGSFGSETNNSESNALRGDDCVFLNSSK